jgi:predicted Zn finger-like uncharacterized protein
MQLVCPACSARYTVSSKAIGEGGKEVRCAKCGHQWFEKGSGIHDAVDEIVDKFEDNVENSLEGVTDHDLENDLDFEGENEGEDEPLEDSEGEPAGLPDDEDDLESKNSKLEDDPDNSGEGIPEGVKPTDEDKKLPVFAQEVIRPQVGRKAKITGLATAAALFGLIVAAGLIYKKQIISAWVPASAIYELLGMPIEFQGKNLVIENLSAQSQRDVDGQNFLLVEGRVINLTSEIQDVPKLFGRLRSTNGVDGQGWEIEPSVTQLKPGESFTFQSDYSALPEGTGSVNVSFSPTVK